MISDTGKIFTELNT